MEDRKTQKIIEGIEKIKKTPWGFLVRRFRVSVLLIFAMIVIGSFSLANIPQEATPEIKIPVGIVTTIYSGASPMDVEKQITDEIEDRIASLEDVDNYTSSSQNSISSIRVEFDADADIDESIRKLREKVDNAKSSLPDDAEDPIVSEISFSDIPILVYSIGGDYSFDNLKKYSDTISDELGAINGVREAKVTGGKEKNFFIDIDPQKIAHFGISLSEVINAINVYSLNFPFGDLEIGNFNYSLRLENEILEKEELENLAIRKVNGDQIFIKDFANVREDFGEEKTISRLFVKKETFKAKDDFKNKIRSLLRAFGLGWTLKKDIDYPSGGIEKRNAENTISISLYRKTGVNIPRIAEESRKKLAELKEKKQIPEDLAITSSQDTAAHIEMSIGNLANSAIGTVILILIVLGVALGIRMASLASIAIPLSFLVTFAFLYFTGNTINEMTLFSLILCLGIMVDASIVMVEGIYEGVNEKKLSPLDAAYYSIWSYNLPVLSGTMTTVCAFLPMLIVSGIMGQYLSFIPKTVSFTLSTAYFISVAIVPMIGSFFVKKRIMKASKKDPEKRKHSSFDSMVIFLKKVYLRSLGRLLNSVSKSIIFIVILFVFTIFMITVPLVTGLIKIEMFPRSDFEYFDVNIELAEGSTLNETLEVAKKVEDIAYDIPELKSFVTTIGATSGSSFLDSGSSNSHIGSVNINIVPLKDRIRKSYEIIDEIRPKVESIKGARVYINEKKAGPQSGAPVGVRVTGSNIEDLEDSARRITKYLEEIPGALNVDNDISKSKTGEIVFSINRAKAQNFGFTIQGIAMNLRAAVNGLTATSVKKGDDEYDIVVQIDPEKIKSISDLENLELISSAGERVFAKDILKSSQSKFRTSINHRNGDRVINVTSDVDMSTTALQIVNEIKNKLALNPLPQGVTVSYGGETEDVTKSYTELFSSFVIAVILISFILILQFGSFSQALVIVIALPFALIGVMLGFLLFQIPLGFMAFIGVVSLTGIVVNDAIVLIDKINFNRKVGMDLKEAISDAGVSRLQPIILTTLTTIFGLLPISLTDPFWLGLGTAVISGLLFSTILTLIAIPIVYYLIALFLGWLRKKWLSMGFQMPREDL